MSKTLRSFFVLIALGLIWGTGYSIARFAITHDVPPLGYSFWQSFGPACIISCILFLRSHFHLKHVKFYLICGTLGIALPNTIIYYAAGHLPASILAMIVNIVPTFTYPMAQFFKLERFDRIRTFGILLAVFGILLIFLPSSGVLHRGLLPWALLVITVPACFAYCSIFITKYRPPQTDSLQLANGMLIASSFILLPIVVLTDQFYVLSLPLTLPDRVILLEMILSTIGYIFFFQLIKIAGPVYYSLVDTVVVIMGIFWGKTIFHEPCNRWMMTALFLLVTGLLLVTTRQHHAWTNANERRKIDAIH